MYPSLHEGFGIPLVEAMRFRKPIVCSCYASIPEIAGSAALYINAKDPVELASSMKRISEDHELRARLVHSGEHRLREFSISKEVKKLAEILLIAKKNNNKLAVFRRYVIRCERECRRVAAALRRRIRAGGEIGNVLQKTKDRLYLLKLKILNLSVKNKLIYFKVEATEVTKWQAKSRFAVKESRLLSALN